MHRFEDLKVWQLSIQLAKDVYLIVSKLPKEERFGLADQLKRSSISIASNIAEGAGRNNTEEFVHFIGIANGSASELMTQLILVRELNLIDSFQPTQFIENIKQIQNMLFKLRQTFIEKKQTTTSKYIIHNT